MISRSCSHEAGNGVPVPGLLGPMEVASYLGVERDEVATYVETAGLPCVVLPGGQQRFRLSAVEAWLDRLGEGGDPVDLETALPANLDSFIRQHAGG